MSVHVIMAARVGLWKLTDMVPATAGWAPRWFRRSSSSRESMIGRVAAATRDRGRLLAAEITTFAGLVSDRRLSEWWRSRRRAAG
ncbi:hypothetical protein GCM10010170_100270 [Dactylosporangium salmoneum]|uniref:Uncharacterized protein n=1 Tax=Dactylosporangium salmoneum TaxID=53361 RepID=A0ABP5UW02_9ACTN